MVGSAFYFFEKVFFWDTLMAILFFSLWFLLKGGACLIVAFVDVLQLVFRERL